MEIQNSAIGLFDGEPSESSKSYDITGNSSKGKSKYRTCYTAQLEELKTVLTKLDIKFEVDVDKIKFDYKGITYNVRKANNIIYTIRLFAGMKPQMKIPVICSRKVNPKIRVPEKLIRDNYYYFNGDIVKLIE